MKFRFKENINSIIKELEQNPPTVIDLQESAMFDNSKGYWFRFKDGKYHSPTCLQTELSLSFFENYIIGGKALMISHKPLPKTLLLAIFSDDKKSIEYNKLLTLYANEEIKK
jgi:hypothetical protein